MFLIKRFSNVPAKHFIFRGVKLVPQKMNIVHFYLFCGILGDNSFKNLNKFNTFFNYKTCQYNNGVPYLILIVK